MKSYDERSNMEFCFSANIYHYMNVAWWEQLLYDNAKIVDKYQF